MIWAWPYQTDFRIGHSQGNVEAVQPLKDSMVSRLRLRSQSGVQSSHSLVYITYQLISVILSLFIYMVFPFSDLFKASPLTCRVGMNCGRSNFSYDDVIWLMVKFWPFVLTLDLYESTGDLLGEGSHGAVHCYLHKHTNIQYAVKVSWQVFLLNPFRLLGLK